LISIFGGFHSTQPQDRLEEFADIFGSDDLADEDDQQMCLSFAIIGVAGDAGHATLMLQYKSHVCRVTSIFSHPELPDDMVRGDEDNLLSPKDMSLYEERTFYPDLAKVPESCSGQLQRNIYIKQLHATGVETWRDDDHDQAEYLDGDDDQCDDHCDSDAMSTQAGDSDAAVHESDVSDPATSESWYQVPTIPTHLAQIPVTS